MKKRQWVLALFISIFLRNRSLSDARWFCGKKRKIGKGNLYLTENGLSWNVMCCASDNHNYMRHTCAKEFLNRASIKKLLTKYQIFTILPQISHFHKFRNFSSIFATFEANCFIPINFMQGHVRNTLFHFCQLPPVKNVACHSQHAPVWSGMPYKLQNLVIYSLRIHLHIWFQFGIYQMSMS